MCVGTKAHPSGSYPSYSKKFLHIFFSEGFIQMDTSFIATGLSPVRTDERNSKYFFLMAYLSPQPRPLSSTAIRDTAGQTIFARQTIVTLNKVPVGVG